MTSLTPNYSPAAGGWTITILGTEFTVDALCVFGGVSVVPNSISSTRRCVTRRLRGAWRGGLEVAINGETATSGTHNRLQYVVLL